MRILFVGTFRNYESIENSVADAMIDLGHLVHRVDNTLANPGEIVRECNSGRFDCLFISKGKMRNAISDFGQMDYVDTQILGATLSAIDVPVYSWYPDLFIDESRKRWRETVEPLLRLGFTPNGTLVRESNKWELARYAFNSAHHNDNYAKENKTPYNVGYLGTLHNNRIREFLEIHCVSGVKILHNIWARDLTAEIKAARIIVGPRDINIPYFWSDRIDIVLGHGGFFLAPEIEGMREEGYIPGKHYAATTDDINDDIAFWLSNQVYREKIAKQGQEFVWEHKTYAHSVKRVMDKVQETL